MAHQPLGGRPVGVVRAHVDIPRPIDDPMLIATASRLDSLVMGCAKGNPSSSKVGTGAPFEAESPTLQAM
ncbi:hypothetical protein GGR58DRAFT_509098 [Xylaria digitata]|nr:hypothetical protein GGR58DRAFT_509098 [Xylaria digitata]